MLSRSGKANFKQGLSSNPKGPLDDHMREVAKKTVKNDAGDAKV